MSGHFDAVASAVSCVGQTSSDGKNFLLVTYTFNPKDNSIVSRCSFLRKDQGQLRASWQQPTITKTTTSPSIRSKFQTIPTEWVLGHRTREDHQHHITLSIVIKLVIFILISTKQMLKHFKAYHARSPLSVRHVAARLRCLQDF